jgi:glutaredoxin
MAKYGKVVKTGKGFKNVSPLKELKATCPYCKKTSSLTFDLVRTGVPKKPKAGCKHLKKINLDTSTFKFEKG